MKSNLLALLRSQEDILSGETLRSRFNTSRVTIWNHIQKLQSLGYNIETSSKGYRLVSSPDTPYPFEFADREDRIHYYASIDSTMATAKQLARNGCPHLSVVIAEEQTRGKGRLKRTWFSDPGGLYFTVVLRPEIPVTQVMRYPFAASVVLCRTIRNATGTDATIKWPNDILFGEKKLCGMLCEMEAETEQVSFVNIGIGINVNNDPTPWEPRACSLSSILGHPVGRVPLLRDFLDAFDIAIQRLNPEAIMEEWKSASATLGKRVRIVTPQQVTEGKAIDIDSNGNLVIEQENHHLETVFYGDCFEIPTENAR